jgi:hypothetical protein
MSEKKGKEWEMSEESGREAWQTRLQATAPSAAASG